jgi:hypothetical protein
MCNGPICRAVEAAKGLRQWQFEIENELISFSTALSNAVIDVGARTRDAAMIVLDVVHNEFGEQILAEYGFAVQQLQPGMRSSVRVLFHCIGPLSG